MGFDALPLRSEAVGKDLSLIGMRGPGEAQVVDNVSGILRVLDSKVRKYGQLDSPLVIAVMSNTTYPTKDYEVGQALFGISATYPFEAVEEPVGMYRDGHWRTSNGWRRSHAPQVIAVQQLKPSSITRVRPRLWATMEPGVHGPSQPSWLGVVDTADPDLSVLGGESLAATFDLPDDWLAGDPEFR